jgi:ribosome biogenesis protein MAK21
VSRFAASILAGESISYPGDPLKDFTSMHFLDRFCFKNPKKRAHAEEAAKKPGAGSAFTRPKSNVAYTPVNTPSFLARAMAAASGSGAALSDDQQFLARYFTQKSRLDSASGKGAARARERELSADATEAEEDAFAEEIIEREMRKVEGGLLDQEEDDLGAYSSGEEEEQEEEGGEDDEQLDYEGADAPMSGDEVDDEAAAEAEALAEMEAGLGGGSDEEEEEEVSGDDDDDDDDEFPLDDEDDDDEDNFGGGGGGGRDSSASVFASAEEFADLLNAANETGVSAKQSAWEKRSSIEERGGRGGGGRGRAGRGGRGGGGEEGGYKSAPKPGNKKGKHGAGGGGAATSGQTPEKPSFKRKLAEARASSGRSGKKKGGGGGGRPAKKQRK